MLVPAVGTGESVATDGPHATEHRIFFDALLAVLLLLAPLAELAQGHDVRRRGRHVRLP